MHTKIKIVLWDYGGVLAESPFKKIKEFEKKYQLPVNTIIRINSNNHLTNAWAKLEKNSISLKEFIECFKKEAEAIGVYKIDPVALIKCLNTSLNEDMVNLLDEVSKKYICACLTNNFSKNIYKDNKLQFEKIKNKFNYIFESSKLLMRKPEKKIYKHVLNQLEVKPDQVMFIDDLGINLKPARRLGFLTHKMIDTKNTIKYIKDTLKLC